MWRAASLQTAHIATITHFCKYRQTKKEAVSKVFLTTKNTKKAQSSLIIRF